VNGRVADALLDVAQTALRLFPWPTRTGLRRVGRPDADSPVLVTGNYDLTVRRLLRDLAGSDAWVVVAPSSGINVWCAAAGGLLTTHQVVTALKTCGVAEHVRHRRAILPQLAATGVIGRDVARRSGWKVVFGPVYAADIADFVARGCKKTDAMRRVRFGARERAEMACAWAAPMSLVACALAYFARPSWTVPVLLQVWVMAAMVFAIYDRIARARFAVAWTAAAATSAAIAAAAGSGPGGMLVAAITATIILAVLTFDFDGSTPIEGGSHFDSKHWHIELDTQACVGVYSCWAVCPEACFEKREASRKVELAHDERCVKCGACVVQCPQDALSFVNERGEHIPPAHVRRYKLNLLGRHGVDAGGH
jgi:ferredoxin